MMDRTEKIALLKKIQQGLLTASEAFKEPVDYRMFTGPEMEIILKLTRKEVDGIPYGEEDKKQMTQIAEIHKERKKHFATLEEPIKKLKAAITNSPSFSESFPKGLDLWFYFNGAYYNPFRSISLSHDELVKWDATGTVFHDFKLILMPYDKQEKR